MRPHEREAARKAARLRRGILYAVAYVIGGAGVLALAYAFHSILAGTL